VPKTFNYFFINLNLKYPLVFALSKIVNSDVWNPIKTPHFPFLIYFVVISRLISEGIFNPSAKKVKTPILYLFNLG